MRRAACLQEVRACMEPDMQISICWLQAERVLRLESVLLGDWGGTRTPRKGCELLSAEQELAEVCEAERNMNPFCLLLETLALAKEGILERQGRGRGWLGWQ